MMHDSLPASDALVRSAASRVDGLPAWQAGPMSASPIAGPDQSISSSSSSSSRSSKSVVVVEVVVLVFIDVDVIDFLIDFVIDFVFFLVVEVVVDVFFLIVEVIELFFLVVFDFFLVEFLFFLAGMARIQMREARSTSHPTVLRGKRGRQGSRAIQHGRA